jgi:Arc/MetJ-type ribon-helix-helix transcriptional regulator
MGNKARDIKSALGLSMKAEESRVAERKLDRFARAEALMEAGAAAHPQQPQTPEHQRVIRDSFTLPANDYAILAVLRERGLKSGVHATKSELVRAGLQMLLEVNEAEFLAALQKLEKVKTGRPSERIVSTIVTV